ncbi:MAG TPA: RNA methyltransferase [Acidimicrobiales bacterium]|nr:RNA methyltransferase [Acidimicrobiales bacterium]
MAEPSPRDRFVTVYGRMPVTEALTDPELTVDKVVVAAGAGGASLARIRDLAAERGVPVKTVPAQRVKLLAGNGRHDQGVVADVVAPRMGRLQDALADPAAKAKLNEVLVLDRVANPANVGMIIRTATAAGLGGIVLPRAGSPNVDPLVVKASAGVAFRAPILHCATPLEGVKALKEAGYRIYGLASATGESLFEPHFPKNVALILGNETEGLSPDTRKLVDTWLSIPMAAGVESINVSAAAAVACFELARRRLTRVP